MKYVCTVCGYEYDEAVGDPDNGIAAGTKWEDLPADFAYAPCAALAKTISSRSDWFHTKNTVKNSTRCSRGVFSIQGENPAEGSKGHSRYSIFTASSYSEQVWDFRRAFICFRLSGNRQIK